MDTKLYLNKKQDLDQQNFKMEENINKTTNKIEKDIPRCPKCNCIIEKYEWIEGIIFNRKKIISFYCPLCDFKNDKKFKINEKQYQKEYR